MKPFSGKKLQAAFAMLAVTLGLWQQPLFGGSYSIGWTREYGGTNSNEGIRGMAIGGDGNIYVAADVPGDYYPDFLLVAYDSDGNLLWTNRYNGPANSYDVPRAIATDDGGNVYVTGESIGTNSDIATVAYSSLGDALWTNRYDSGSSDVPSGIATDHSNHVFVTGGSGNNWITIAYTSTGAELWTNVLTMPPRGGQANAIATDNAGHVYVTGESAGNYQTVACSAATGSLLWSKTYNGTGNSEDYSLAVAVGGNGNVYITGQSTGLGTSYDIVTIAYSSNGVALWTNVYNGAANDYDIPNAITVGSEGNVYVVGQGSELTADWVILAYSSAGTPLWTRNYNGPANNSERANDVATDSCGNVYVSGYSYSIGDFADFAVIAYTSAGVPLWTNIISSPGAHSDDALRVRVNSTGAIVAAGQTFVENGIYPVGQLLTVKYISAPVAAISPSNQTVPAGSEVTFTATACGTGLFGFQWRKNGTNLVDGGNIEGATTTALTVSDTTVSDAGTYTFLVSNAAATNASAPAVLTIIERPFLIPQPWSSVTGFSFSFVGHSNTLYRVDVSTNLTDWNPLGFAASFTDTIIYNDAQSKNSLVRFYRVTRP